MIPVCAAVILRSGKILLARRRPGLRHAGMWEFPGGRVEPEETPAAALAAEARATLSTAPELELSVPIQVMASDARFVPVTAIGNTWFTPAVPLLAME